VNVNLVLGRLNYTF